ncbi:Hpt domain protein [Roseovarius albus]|uniref:Hpt domain protein n=1 Tax=Roseovarius albus TaxID=1247867 RepID=A0A1X6Z5D4_9RHOB|nr:Hpt domain-containing protein [Roseovarius albus]SLN41569.1 Hpt domain protein [Roseovarius albus]
MIDWNRVIELRYEIGEEDFGEIVSLFLDEVETEITKLTTLETCVELGEMLHFLKGSALNLGFADFANLCQHGEDAADKGNSKAIDPEQVLGSYFASKSAFLSGLENRLTA